MLSIIYFLRLYVLNMYPQQIYLPQSFIHLLSISNMHILHKNGSIIFLILYFIENPKLILEI